jgi:tetratricopeptide (TPR) repeat protein
MSMIQSRMKRTMTGKLVISSPVSTQKLLGWTNGGLELLWLLTVVLVPLAFVSRGYLLSAATIAYVEVPKIAVLHTLVGLMAVLWLLEWGLRGRPFPPSFFRSWFKWNPTGWLFLAVALYLASILLSTALSTSLGVSLWGEVPGEDGYATYTVITYVVLFAVVSTHLKTRSQLSRLLGAIVFMGVLVAAFAVMQNYGYDPFDLREPPNTDRSTSTMGNAILAGSVMLMTIPISLVAAVVFLQRRLTTTGFWVPLALWTLVLTAQVMGITFIQSRGAWVGTAVALAVLLGSVHLFMGRRFFMRAALPLVLAVGLTAAVVFLPARFESFASPERAEDSAEDSAQASPDVGTIALSRLTSIKGQVVGGGLSGRLDIWENSWRLMVDHPWFEFDTLSLAVLRPVIGYGPDLFRYVYMLESPPRGPDRIPREPVHAHNFFIHQGVEAGFLGLLTSLGIFLVPLGVVVYLLVRQRQNYSTIGNLVLIGLLATLAGRWLEQMVGIARVSDLTIFWVLLATLAALPFAVEFPQPAQEIVAGPNALLPQSPGVSAPERRSYGWLGIWKLLVIGFLIGGIAVLTWTKTINYPLAAVSAAKGEEHSLAGNFQSALKSLNRAIDLAPDIWINYSRRAAIYSAVLQSDTVIQGVECALPGYQSSHDVCLAQQAQLDFLEGADQRPLNFRSRRALAISARNLSSSTNDKNLQQQTINSFWEVVAMVPNGWPLLDQLAAVYLAAGQPEAALGPLGKSLSITGDTHNASGAHIFLGVAYRELGQPLIALEEFGEAIRLSPGRIDSYIHRATIYWIVGQRQRAIQDLDQAINLADRLPQTDPLLRLTYAEALSNRGFAYRELGQPLRAIEDLNRAVELDPQFAPAYNHRGLAYSDLEEHQKSIADYNKAIKLDPQFVQAYLNRGEAYSAVGRPDQTLLDAGSAITLDPLHAGAFALRALAFTALGNHAEADRDLERAVELGFRRDVLESRIHALKNGP